MRNNQTQSSTSEHRDVHVFRAPTMQEALARVRRSLGPDALILQTRQVEKKGKLPWQKGTVETEITAATDMEVPDLQQRQAEFNRLQQRETLPSGQSEERATLPSHLSSALAGQRDEIELRSSTSRPTSAPAPAPAPARSSAPAQKAPSRPERPQAPAPQTSANAIINETLLIQKKELEVRLSGVEKLLTTLTSQMKTRLNESVPDDVYHLYTSLLDAEVDDASAKSLCLELKRIASPEQLRDETMSRRLMSGLIESQIHCVGPMALSQGHQKVVALIGPTGVGKTTTIAKLAANYRLQEGVQMGLITIDTYRIAAVEQLKTYAEIIDLPMKVVTTPSELKKALDEMSHLDLVLVDTAGRSPKDELKIHELKALLSPSYIDEIHLVLSATSSLKSLETIVEKFSVVKLDSIVVTKLDESVGPGVLYSLQQRIGLPYSFLTTGQDVPEDIEAAHGMTISEMIMPSEVEQAEASHYGKAA